MSWRRPSGPARWKLRVSTTSRVTMNTTLTAKTPRKPISGGSGTPNTQLDEIGPKTANSHGHHGRRPPAGPDSAGKTSAAHRMQRQHHDGGAEEDHLPGVGLPGRAAEEERPVQAVGDGEQEEDARDARPSPARQHQRGGEHDHAGERQHAPRIGDRHERDGRVAGYALALVGERHAQVTRSGRRRIGARDEAERPDATQIGIAHPEKSIARLQAAGRGWRGARPEAAHGRDVVAARWRRDVDPDPRELAARDLLQVQDRAGDEEPEEEQPPPADRTECSHAELPVLRSATFARTTRTDQAAGSRNWSLILKRRTVARPSPV